MPIPARRTSHTASAFVPALAGVVLVACLVASCSNATGPGTSVTVGVVSVSGPSYYASAEGNPYIVCDVRLEAHNVGSESATWTNAVFSYFTLSDTTTPFATDNVGSAALASIWGAATIGPDSTRMAGWHLTATAPWLMRMRFYLQTANGARDSTSTATACEPSTTTAPPPTIATFTVRDTVLEPSDTLHVSFSATSTVNLWESVVRLTGPCQVTVKYSEQPSPHIAHDVPLPLPAACNLDSAVTVTVSAIDALVQTGSGSITLPHLVDHTAPSMSFIVRTPYQDWAPAGTAAGYVFAGDSIGIEITAVDNNVVSTIYWDIAPVNVGDSNFVDQVDTGIWYPSIPIPSGWPDTLEVGAYARDAAGNVSDTVMTAAGAIHVYPTLEPAPAPVTVAGDANDVAIDQKRGVLYVLQLPSRIAVLSLATGGLLDTIPLPAYALGFDLTPGGDSLLVSLQTAPRLVVVDLTQPSPVVTTITLPGLDSTYSELSVKMASTGTALVIAQKEFYEGAYLYSYDFRTDSGEIRTDAPVLGDTASGALERSTDGNVIVANGLAGGFVRYDALTNTFGAAQTARVLNTTPTLDSTGSHVVVAGDVYDGSLQYVRTMLPAVDPGEPGVLSPDGQTYYAVIAPNDTTRGIARYRVSDGALLDRIPVRTPVQVLRISPDGTVLVATPRYNYGGIPLLIIDLTQLH